VRLRGFLAALALALVAVPGVACETEPDVAALPGETPEALEARRTQIHTDQWVVRRYLREREAYKAASAIFIARVITSDLSKSNPSTTRLPPRVTVQPLHEIKGALPAAHRTLTQTEWTSCGNHGDGDAPWATVGEIVFVFEGLPATQDRPHGIDSIRAVDARTTELLDPLYRWAKDNRR
jgi:hypothetical protein